MTSKSFSRRDLLKLLALAPLGMAFEPLSKLGRTVLANTPHIIIMVFDAWSANNVSLYGYPRPTMPNLERFAERSIVYHRHYSTGTYTVPGTASLLTGMYPWTHRALNLGSGIRQEHQEKQIFKALSTTHHSLGYAQNVYADQFLYQAGAFLKRHYPFGKFNKNDVVTYDLPLFDKDAFIAFSSFEDVIFQHGKGLDGSLFLGPLARLLGQRDKKIAEIKNAGAYVSGLPESLESFLLSDLVEGFIQTLGSLSEPSLVYFHFYPPHDPYRPTSKFYNQFLKDDYRAIEKPVHALIGDAKSSEELHADQVKYDAYLASWDAELRPLFDYLDRSGMREKSHILITSDHGEMHERGISGHGSPLIFEPVIHVPLIVSSPGDQKRVNIYTPTSSLDILPTIAWLSGSPVPDWAEGELLPGLGGSQDFTRSIYAVDAQTNPANSALKQYSAALTKGNYRLTKYEYTDFNQVEFYDLAEDPHEINNIYPSLPSVAKEMEAELSQKIMDVNASFEKTK